MATITGDGWIRYTYTLTDNPETKYATIKITKIEARDTDAPSDGSWSILAGTFSFYYTDSSGGRPTTSISHSEFKIYPTWHTVWTGTKTINSYKSTSQGYVLCSNGGCQITYSSLTPYTIRYDANGGLNAPTSQTKYYTKTLILTYGKPTRTGYTFVNWKSNESTPKYYLSGASYTTDAAATMTAQWSANKYSVTYSSNGGIGNVSSQIRTFDDTNPTYFQTADTLKRKEISNGITTEYIPLRWNTNPDDTGISYDFNDIVPNVANNIKVYAIWEPKYIYPMLNNLQDFRTKTADITDNTRYDNGEYIYISFNFTGCSTDNGESYTVPKCVIRIDDDFYYSYEHDEISADFSMSFTSGHTGTLIFKPAVVYNTDTPHNITITLFDSSYATSSYTTHDYITTAIYPIDLHDNPTLNEVYMGIMHPYVPGQLLTIQDLYTDGNSVIKLDVDENASLINDAVSGADKDLFNAIIWGGQTDCLVNSNNSFYLDSKKLLTKLYNSELDPLNNIISNNDDLNDYVTYGKYYRQISIAPTISNCPSNLGSVNFMLEVKRSVYPKSIKQIITFLSTPVCYARGGRFVDGFWTWDPWYYMGNYLIGEIKLYGSVSCPIPGWVYCDGRALDVNVYNDLFRVIQTRFGGDGVNTFNVPDLRGRTPIGLSNVSTPNVTPAIPSGISLRTIGDTGGSEDAIIPYHRHERGGNWYKSGGTSGSAYKTTSGSNYTSAAYTGYAGTSGNTKGANMPPFVVVNYIIYHGVI